MCYRHEWKSLPNHIMSDKKSVFTVTQISSYFLRLSYALIQHTNPPKNHSLLNPPFSPKGWSFQTSHCDVTTVHSVTSLDHVRRLFCKLAQRRSSLNNNREYWFLANRYLQRNVQAFFIFLRSRLLVFTSKWILLHWMNILNRKKGTSVRVVQW